MSECTTARPSLFQVALARTVVRAKPDGLSIREFISDLVEKISSRADPIQYAQSEYVDGVDHWRSLYIRAESEKSATEAQNSKLQQRVHELEALVQTQTAEASKRQRDAAEAVGPSRSTKRARASKSKPLAHVEQSCELYPDYGSLSNSPEGPLLCHHVFKMHECLDQTAPDSKFLAFHLIQASSSLWKLMFRICLQAIRPTLPRDISPLNSIGSEYASSRVPNETSLSLADALPAIARCISLLLYGCSRLGENGTDSGERAQGAVIYAYIDAFSKMLDIIRILCLSRAHAEAAAAPEPSHRSGKQPTLESNNLKKEFVEAGLPESRIDAPKQITNVMLAIFGQLSSVDVVHRALFEGLMYLILNRASESLRFLTFGREEPIDLDRHGWDQILSSTRSSDVLEALIDQADKDTEGAAVGYEVIHIGKLMERANSLALTFLRSLEDTQQAEKRKANSKSKSTRSARMKRMPPVQDKESLPRHIRERLQQTLINSMFAGGEEAESDEFTDCLRMPPKIGAPQPPRSKAEKEMMEQKPGKWFFEKAWKLIGWEILLRED